MLVTVSGITMLVIPGQLRNKYPGIVVIPSSKMIDERFVHPTKAP